MSRIKKTVLTCIGIAMALIAILMVWHSLLRPTKILVVNPLPAQKAEIILNNDSRLISVTCTTMEEARDFSKYDAVLMYGRGLYLDSIQMADLEKAAHNGVPVFTNSLRNFNFVVNHNLDSIQSATLQTYFANPCRPNYRNLLRYVRHLSTPRRLGDQDYDLPVNIPSELFYHLEPGKYFKDAHALTQYLKDKGLYHQDGRDVAFISGVSFPVESNRAHVDTIVTRLTQSGYNVYPITATGEKRSAMIKEVNPDAIVYFPMGRLGNDSLLNWVYAHKIPLFMPFPLTQTQSEWLDIRKPLEGGTLNARIVVPEIDGGMSPLCIATQDPDPEGYILFTPQRERVDAFMDQFNRFMRLQVIPDKEKRIAIVYFKSPGKDALLASGMEVVPSLYNFLSRLSAEGYDVSGLPSSMEEFGKMLNEQGSVMGSYAPAAQKRFIEECNPIRIDKRLYEKWAETTLSPEKYAEVEMRYGKAPGNLLASGDTICMAALRFGNILLFPQPRPALGDDDFKLVHGADVAPPHSYIAPYLYMQNEFDADAIIHFGTHGNLEFTPGKNAALSKSDWADVLIGGRPHFYFYTTGNIGEAIIAKRRSHAVIVTHLTPPFTKSGLRQKYASLLMKIHEAISNSSANSQDLKREIIAQGFHKDLGLDSIPEGRYTTLELQKIDAFLEELANEKITGAYYVMGVPYSGDDMTESILAITADKLAYSRAKNDFHAGKISQKSLQDFALIAHNYHPGASRDIKSALSGNPAPADAAEALRIRQLLTESAGAEIDAMVGALNGIPLCPAPGGDPVINTNVLPMGRNMFSINAEVTPGEKAWNDGVVLAEHTLDSYLKKHGEYPRKISFTFWAGEFISSQGATVAQALRMLGVEPVRDGQGRVIDLKLTSSEELGRPRINILVQVSGQLRDIASSRLKMLTDAVTLAASAKDDKYPNFVAEGTIEQEKALLDKGESPKRARELSTMRGFGPVNTGYSTGMLHFTENSGEWDDREQLVDGFLNNMCAIYGDDSNWGTMNKDLFKSAVAGTDVIVQPRQSNTWGPISLDHVYEFTGALSLAAKSLGGKEPDAVMADYRNPWVPRMQDTKEAVAVETRATILNPEYIKNRMKGGATTAQMFGEIFRNIFGWSATRPSVLADDIYDRLYDIYVADKDGIGIEEYFNRVNPAALQEMTATMLESARKGFWKADDKRISAVAEMHARITRRHGAPCTEFVCANRKLQEYTASHLSAKDADKFLGEIGKATAAQSGSQILKKDERNLMQKISPDKTGLYVIIALALCICAYGCVVIFRRRANHKTGGRKENR